MPSFVPRTADQSRGCNRKNFFSVCGRISRTEFLLQFIAVLAFAIILKIAAHAAINDPTLVPGRIILLPADFFIAGIFVFLMLFPVVKRAHDVNLSGWYFFFILLPMVNVLAMAYLVLKPSDTGHNEYGARPGEEAVEAAAA